MRIGKSKAEAITIIFGAFVFLAIIVLIIDWDTKKRLLAAAEELKGLINDGRIQTASDKGNRPDPNHNGNLPSDLVADGIGAMEKEGNSSSNGRTPRARKSSGQPRTRNNSPEIPAEPE
jgi:hypothetical protein